MRPPLAPEPVPCRPVRLSCYPIKGALHGEFSFMKVDGLKHRASYVPPFALEAQLCLINSSVR